MELKRKRLKPNRINFCQDRYKISINSALYIPWNTEDFHIQWGPHICSHDKKKDDGRIWKNKKLEGGGERERGRERERERDRIENSYQRKPNVICPANDVQGASRRERERKERGKPSNSGRGHGRQDEFGRAEGTTIFQLSDINKYLLLCCRNWY